MNNSNNTLLAKCTYLANCFASKAGRFIIQEPGKQIRTVHNLSELNFNKHFTGEERNGISPDVGEDCNFAVVDIDRMDTEQIKQFEFAQNIKKELLSEYNLQALIEQSKSKGYHVWIPFDGKIKRRFIQKLLTKVIRKFTDKKIANGIIEIFPKGNGGTSIFFPCFNSITPDGNSFSENFLTTKSTAILKDNGDVDTNFIANFARATICNTKTLQMLAWLDKYPPCFTKAYLNWAQGVRNGYTLAIAGICEKLGLPLEEAIEAIRTIAEDCNDEELQARINIVKATYKKENPAGCSILQGKCEGIPVSAICSENCSFVKTIATEIENTLEQQKIDIISFIKSSKEIKELPPMEYVVNDVLPRKFITILFSEAGCGKTWLLLDLAIAISNGNPVWGNYISTKCKILFFEADAVNQLFKKRLEKLQCVPNDDNLKFVNLCDLEQAGVHINLLDKKSQKIFEEFLECFNPDLVIVDTLFGFSDADESNMKEAKKVIDFFKNMAVKFNCNFLLAHHSRKRLAGEKKKAPDMSDLIGSSVLNRAPASIYTIISTSEDENKTSGIVKNVKNWEERIKTFKFEIAENTNGNLILNYNAENIPIIPKNKNEKIESYILDAISYAHDSEFRKDELARDFEVSLGTVDIAIKKLEAKKILKRVGATKGAYYIANIEKNCKNNIEIADNNTLAPELEIDRKIVRLNDKKLFNNNLTKDKSASNKLPDNVSDFFS